MKETAIISVLVLSIVAESEKVSEAVRRASDRGSFECHIDT